MNAIQTTNSKTALTADDRQTASNVVEWLGDVTARFLCMATVPILWLRQPYWRNMGGPVSTAQATPCNWLFILHWSTQALKEQLRLRDVLWNIFKNAS